MVKEILLEWTSKMPLGFWLIVLALLIVAFILAVIKKTFKLAKILIIAGVIWLVLSCFGIRVENYVPDNKVTTKMTKAINHKQ